VDAWVKDYANRQSGKTNTTAQQGWEKIRKALYNKKISYCGDGNILSSRPCLTGSAGYAYLCDGFANIPLLGEGIMDLLKADQQTLQQNRYQYDLVNFTRQLIDFTGRQLRDEMTLAYYQNDKEAFEKAAKRLLEAHDDLDTLLQTRPEFLIGTWTNAARSFGINDAESDRYEISARVLVSTWGQEGSQLTDYAHRDRAGLVRDYYKKRWQLFVEKLRNTIGTDQAIDMDAFNKEIASMEWKWAHSHNPYSDQPKGDALALVRKLAPKYIAIQSDKKIIKKELAKWKFDATANPKLTAMTFDISSGISHNGKFLIRTKYYGKKQARRIVAVRLITPKGTSPLAKKDDFYTLHIEDYKKADAKDAPQYQLRLTFGPQTEKSEKQATGQLQLLESK